MIRPLLCATLLCVTPVFADPQQDAEYIVSQTVTKSIFETALTAQRDIIIGAIANDLRENDLELTDPERYFDIIVEEFIDGFTHAMQEQSVDMYLELFSDEDLADIAMFYKTPAGKTLVATTPTLMLRGAQMGAAAGEAAGAQVGGRIVKRLEAEGIQPFTDPSMMDRLRDMFK